MLKRILADNKNRSFADPKLTILKTVECCDSIQPADTIIFIHPPKTGGTNLCYVTDAIQHINPDFKATRFPVPRIPNKSPGLISESWLGGLESALEKLSLNPDYCNDFNFISGHFPFGLHHSLKKSVKYIALVRDPVGRSISTTNFDYQRGYVDKVDVEKYLFETEIDNPQTRMFAGQQYMNGVCNEEVLAQAKKNIDEYFLLIGVTEDTSSFIQILASIQGWGSLAIAKTQVTGEKAIIAPSEDIINRLTLKHQFDIELYKWVKDRWFEWKEKFVRHLQRETSENLNEKILCITHDFATTHKPMFMTEREIINYNMGLSADLIEVNQNHTELKTNIEKSLKNEQNQAALIIQNSFMKNQKIETESNALVIEEMQSVPLNSLK